jgi:hypothetical protein
MRFLGPSWWQPESASRRAYWGAGSALLLGAAALVIFFVGGGPVSRWVELALAVFLFLWAAAGLSQAVGLGKDERRRTSWVVTREQEWDAALAELREAGWQAKMTGLAAPVRIEGVLPCGERFCFRSRFNEILLAVGGADPARGAPWQQRSSYGTPEKSAASYLTAQAGLPLLLDLAAQHRSECPHSAGPPAA